MCSTEWAVYFYPAEELVKFGKGKNVVLEECDFDVLEKRSINAGHNALKVGHTSSEIKAVKNGEQNSLRVWR